MLENDEDQFDENDILNIGMLDFKEEDKLLYGDPSKEV